MTKLGLVSRSYKKRINFKGILLSENFDTLLAARTTEWEMDPDVDDSPSEEVFREKNSIVRKRNVKSRYPVIRVGETTIGSYDVIENN